MRELQKMPSLEACPENSERGGWDTCPHASYIHVDTFLFFCEVYKNNTEFQKKKGWPQPPRPTPKSTLDH